MDLRVATFNIRTALGFDGRHAWPFRRRSTAAMARLLDADVLGLQEAYRCQARYLDRELPEHERFGRGRNAGGGGESCRLLVRTTRLRVVTTSTRWFGAEPDRPGSRLPGARFPRIATDVVVVDEPTGRTFRVVNVHLDATVAANRAASARQVAGWVDPDQPTVVLGDLNATPTGQPEVFAALVGAGLRSALVDDGGIGTFHGYRGGVGHPWIDHVHVSRHWDVLDAGVVTGRWHGRDPSDHWPVAATVALRDG